jgi:hypothetical protein
VGVNFVFGENLIAQLGAGSECHTLGLTKGVVAVEKDVLDLLLSTSAHHYACNTYKSK